METKEVLVDLFENNGIFIPEDDFNTDLEFDSLQFIAIIVSIEEIFKISIDESFLLPQKLKSYNDFYNMINFYLNKMS